ncbi:MAG: hypothetical protein ABI878_01835 [Acidobacteriota bacterium]
MKGETNLARSITTAESVAVAKALINRPAATMINRDLSLVEFYWRVVEEASDTEIPLLERVKFIGIVAELIDEFFMIRVAGLKAKSGALMEVTRMDLLRLSSSPPFASVCRSSLRCIIRRFEMTFFQN